MKKEINKAIKVLKASFDKVIVNKDGTYSLTWNCKTEVIDGRELMKRYHSYLSYIKSERNDFEENHKFVEKQKIKIAEAE